MIYQRPSFERRYKKLTRQQQARVDTAVGSFEETVGHPHVDRNPPAQLAATVPVWPWAAAVAKLERKTRFTKEHSS